MPDYLVVRAMEKDSVVLPRTVVYGEVEFRSAKSDSAAEICAIKESCASFGLQPDDFMITARVATIVKSADAEEAIEASAGKISEIIDIKSSEYHISNYEAASAGFVKNLDNGEIAPILRNGFRPSLAFVRDPSSLQVFDIHHYILSLENELSQRYKRSLHWSRNARHERNAQLKILFLWFSLEALVKEGESDNIEGLVRWFLGFPNGRHLQALSKTLGSELRDHKLYDFWERELKLVVDKIREFRNDSVHSGFRNLDFTAKELALYSQVVTYATSRGQRTVVEGLRNGFASVSEFKDYIAPLFESVVSIEDVHGNIIFSLENARLGK